MSKEFDPSQHGGDNMDGFTQPPPDEYVVRIEETELKTATTGSQYIKLTLRICACPNSEDDIYEHANSKFWDTLSTLEAAWWKIGDCCKSIGQASTFDIESPRSIRDALEGRVGKVRTKWEEYEGQKRTKVAKWLTCSDEERALARQGGQQSRGDPSPERPKRPGPSRDDIPF